MGRQRKETAGYQALHLRVGADRGAPQHCDECGTSDPDKFYDWANISGRYEDVNDYRRLCRACHMTSDGRLERLRVLGKRLRPIVPPKPCIDCRELWKPLRHGRCGRCSQRWAKAQKVS